MKICTSYCKWQLILALLDRLEKAATFLQAFQSRKSLAEPRGARGPHKQVKKPSGMYKHRQWLWARGGPDPATFMCSPALQIQQCQGQLSAAPPGCPAAE